MMVTHGVAATTTGGSGIAGFTAAAAAMRDGDVDGVRKES
jgi:hypothetical protein